MELEAPEASWRRRRAQQGKARRAQAEAARVAARAAAEALRREFGADEVRLFGSLAVGPRHDNFDVDPAVRGLAPERHWAALARVSERVRRPVDLLHLECCTDRMRHAVAATGERIDG